jgi:hypothetical protein
MTVVTSVTPTPLTVAPIIKVAQMSKEMLDDFLGFSAKAISIEMTDQVS